MKKVTSNTGNTITVVGTWDVSRQPNDTSRYVLAEDSKIGQAPQYPNFTPAIQTVRETLEDTALMDHNSERQTNIQSLRSDLKTSLQLHDSDFIRIPALFNDYDWDDWESNPEAVAHVHGMVNMLVASARARWACRQLMSRGRAHDGEVGG